MSSGKIKLVTDPRTIAILDEMEGQAMTHNPADRSEMDELVKPEVIARMLPRLRNAEELKNIDPYVEPVRLLKDEIYALIALCESAQAIQSLQDRVKALEGALEPFAAMVPGYERHMTTLGPEQERRRNDEVLLYCSWPDEYPDRENFRKLHIGDLRRASAVKDGKA